MTLNSSAGSFLYGANNKASGFTTPNFTEGVLFDGTVTITGITITSVSTGCVTTLADITVTVNPKPTATVTATPTCFGGSNGTATANPVGGTSPYSYLWNTTGTTQTITALAPALIL
ncbi:MAG: SprB repeat-containing protein [Sphingobacteriales bacterium]|nr:SprB repeat-containing protein [Sphingobacteriales bacterium]